MRSGGVLMHISSLPSPYGIGTLGAEARSFIDFLHKGGQRYWQVLPLSPTGCGDSPYQSFSSYAGNPYFIDLEMLKEEGFLKGEEFEFVDWGNDPEKVDYGKIYMNRHQILKLAARRLLAKNDRNFHGFCQENSHWVEDYSLFMALKDKFEGKPWTTWPLELRLRQKNDIKAVCLECDEEINIYKAIQYFFYKQWNEVKTYAHEKGVEIIGDIPIYAAMDSVDVWACPYIFHLDKKLDPIEVAGCPPDGFSVDGQLWGNPLYNWDVLKEDNYSWWIRRIDHQFKLFEVLRIDHFRGFDQYFAIPADAENAKHGRWCKGPGIELFKALGPRRIIAEDLGFLTDSVRELLRESGYPGMKILQFAFDSREESDYLPHNYTRNSVAYLGTHDNSTMRGWFNSAKAEDRLKAQKYMRIGAADDVSDVALETLWRSAADLAVISMQDLLGLDDTARMNTPGTLRGNWRWRMKPNTCLDSIGERLCRITELYGRKA